MTRDGENILSALDTWAISVLRENKLVWSGWGDANDLGNLHSRFGEHIGVRTVELDSARLRLFFHSLLWRAAASTRVEFQEVVVPADDLETLRKSLLGQVIPDISFYPVQLTQLSTKGPMHNRTPYRDVKYLPNLEDKSAPPVEMKTFRFYFDGLIAHVVTELPPSYEIENIRSVVVGAEERIAFSTVTFEGSLQARERLEVLKKYHPDIVA